MPLALLILTVSSEQPPHIPDDIQPYWCIPSKVLMVNTTVVNIILNTDGTVPPSTENPPTYCTDVSHVDFLHKQKDKLLLLKGRGHIRTLHKLLNAKVIGTFCLYERRFSKLGFTIRWFYSQVVVIRSLKVPQRDHDITWNRTQLSLVGCFLGSFPMTAWCHWEHNGNEKSKTCLLQESKRVSYKKCSRELITTNE